MDNWLNKIDNKHNLSNKDFIDELWNFILDIVVKEKLTITCFDDIKINIVDKNKKIEINTKNHQILTYNDYDLFVIFCYNNSVNKLSNKKSTPPPCSLDKHKKENIFKHIPKEITLDIKNKILKEQQEYIRYCNDIWSIVNDAFFGKDSEYELLYPNVLPKLKYDVNLGSDIFCSFMKQKILYSNMEKSLLNIKSVSL